MPHIDSDKSTLYHCYNMRTSLQRIGNSQGVIIPKPLLAQVGLAGEIEMSVEDDAIVIRKLRPAVRAGWAEASKAIAAKSDDGLVWPEFANAGDSEFRW
jgi:antitoxin MazE